MRVSNNVLRPRFITARVIGILPEMQSGVRYGGLSPQIKLWLVTGQAEVSRRGLALARS